MAREGRKTIDARSLRLADWAGEESLEGRDGERPRTAVVVDEDASWIEAVERLLGRLGIATVGVTESPDHALDLVAEALLERETIDGSEVARIVHESLGEGPTDEVIDKPIDDPDRPIIDITPNY